MFRRFFRHIKEGFFGVFRHLGMALSSASAVMITLILIGLFLIVTLNLYDMTKTIEDSISISVLIEKGDEDSHETIEEQILKIDGVKSVTYRTPEEEFDYYLVKFGNSQYNSAELEMSYYELATMAGINMMPSKLYQVDGNNHFMTKRFDRNNGKKIHTQTLAAISPDADSYEQLITVCRKLHLPETDCYEVFRRMVFNVLANNTDDHNKNFSFVMSEDGTWRLSPAYDVTYIFDNGGFLPNEDHCMYIRAKLRDITRDDVIQFAKDNGIRRPDAIIRDIVNAIKQFRTVATKYCVAEQWIGRVENTIFDRLKSWGELEEMAPEIYELVINGHIIKNIRIEQAYKGNFHLLAEIDGHERKFIIGKNKEEFSLIESMGIANLSSDQLKDMVEKYFIH